MLCFCVFCSSWILGCGELRRFCLIVLGGCLAYPLVCGLLAICVLCFLFLGLWLLFFVRSLCRSILVVLLRRILRLFLLGIGEMLQVFCRFLILVGRCRLLLERMALYLLVCILAVAMR